MLRYSALAASLVALAIATPASANGSSDQNRFQVVDLGEFQGGADFLRAQERLQLALLSPRIRSISRLNKPQLVSFDGQYEFLKTSRRLRIWRPDVAYTLSVGPDGHVTACEITESFRRTYVNQKLCDVLSKHHHFEPAQDDSASPVAGKYSARLNYVDIRTALDE